MDLIFYGHNPIRLQDFLEDSIQPDRIILINWREWQYTSLGEVNPTFEQLVDLANFYNCPFYVISGENQISFLYDRTNPRYNKVEIISFGLYFWIITYEQFLSDQTKKSIITNRQSLGLNGDINYLFTSLNNKAHWHRCLQMDLLEKYKLIEKGAITWNSWVGDRGRILSESFSNYVWKYWQPRILKSDEMNLSGWGTQLPKEYSNSFIHLVSESSDTFMMFSEKSIIPILFNKPFLISGCVGFHKKLEDMGFSLYDELFDYSFDNETDTEKRFDLLTQNLIKYKDYNLKELENLRQKILEKTIYNKLHLIKIIKDVDNWPKFVVDLCESTLVNIEESNKDNLYSYYQSYKTQKRKLFDMKKVSMIGVGKLGQDCAEVMAEHYDVVGYDVVPRNPKNFKMCSSIEESVKGRNIIFIAVPTAHDPIYGGETPTSHLPNKDFDYSAVIDVLKEVNQFTTKEQLVVLISTVLPGTVRNLLAHYITNARFVYNPYLIAMGTVKWDMVNPEMVIIGTHDGSKTHDAEELINFYRVFMENDPRYEVGTWDEAESIKIFYNTFISTKLTLVNMIQDVAEANGNINVDVVTNALAQSTHRITGPAYMKAGMGDGGACHPRDNIALRFLAEKLNLGYDLFDSIMKAREVQAERIAKTCLRYGSKICIIGKAYKPGVPYTNGSYSLLVGHFIEKNGGTVNYFDINTGDQCNLQEQEVFFIGYWELWVENIVKNLPTSTVVIDPWRKVNSEIFTGSIVNYGNTRNVN